jgi:hypothetical protein
VVRGISDRQIIEGYQAQKNLEQHMIEKIVHNKQKIRMTRSEDTARKTYDRRKVQCAREIWQHKNTTHRKNEIVRKREIDHRKNEARKEWL